MTTQMRAAAVVEVWRLFRIRMYARIALSALIFIGGAIAATGGHPAAEALHAIKISMRCASSAVRVRTQTLRKVTAASKAPALVRSKEASHFTRGS